MIPKNSVNWSMIQRSAKKQLLDLASKFKAVAVVGPRQSGKTTLVKAAFPTKPYVSLENPDTRLFATEDARGFLSQYAKGAIFDEIQRVPALFSYLQEIVDDNKQTGLFILTGSNNFLLQENITQSLAGRVGYLELLPFSLQELNTSKNSPKEDNTLLFTGFYPPIYDQNIPAQDWCPNYIRTYIDRDVRQLKNINNLYLFEKFIRIIAGRNGCELNNNAIAVEAGIDVKTVQSWIGILQNSYIIYLLKPHFQNFNKTVVKRPKLYFYDSALVCSLLNITKPQQLEHHPLRGAMFEGMVVTELIKNRTNNGLPKNLYYWRDKTGREIDIIIDNAGQLYPIEIKSGETVSSAFFKNLTYWNKLSNTIGATVLYAGDPSQKRSNQIDVINWRAFIIQEPKDL